MMKRYFVEVECLTRDRRVRQTYNGTRTGVLVFAQDHASARFAAIDKMTDKWLRHQGLQTKWKALAVNEA